jgi:hypothetical protein
MPTATIVPQQLIWWKPATHVSAVVHPLSNVGKAAPPPQVPATGGGHLLLLQVLPAVQALPLATHLPFAGSQQPLPQSAPLQHAWPGPPHT